MPLRCHPVPVLSPSALRPHPLHTWSLLFLSDLPSPPAITTLVPLPWESHASPLCFLFREYIFTYFAFHIFSDSRLAGFAVAFSQSMSFVFIVPLHCPRPCSCPHLSVSSCSQTIVTSSLPAKLLPPLLYFISLFHHEHVHTHTHRHTHIHVCF